MKILINTIGRDLSDSEEWRLITIIRYFHEHYPDDEIGIVCHEGLNNFTDLKDGRNVRILSVRHTAFLNHLNEKKQVRSFTEAENPDAIISIKAIENCSYNQFLLPPSYFFQSEKPEVKEIVRFKKEIESSKSVITFAELEKNRLSSFFASQKDKFEKIYLISIPKNKSITFNEKQPIKQRWAAGNEFFLCHPTWNKDIIINTLKGFSGFKKWQQSHMKLILTAWNKKDEASIKELIKDYRFKENTGIIRMDEFDFPKVISAAYAFIVPNKLEANFDLPLKSIAAEIPVIIPRNSILSEKLGNAAFCFEDQNKDDIARILLESFRDEQKRSGIIQSSSEVLKDLEKEDLAVSLKEILSGRQHQNIS